MIDLKEFWTENHRTRNARWLAFSDPNIVLSRFNIWPRTFESVLEVGPGVMYLADHLSGMGKKVFVHDIVEIDDPRYVAKLPMKEKVDIAIAHLVFQHVPRDQQLDLLVGVLGSLKLGGKFYFDAVTDKCHDNPELHREFESGTSFPFAPWELVSERQEVSPGYFFCVVEA